MQNLPHHYFAKAAAPAEGHINLSSQGLTDIESAGPAEFGGPGDLWSPETLLVAAIADCFILTFRAIARASKLEWVDLTCTVEGVLDRVDKVTQFTEFKLRVVLDVPSDADELKSMRLLEKAEAACLITNSMKSAVHLEAEIRKAN
ncbi:MAG: OsmC family protein [Granulosicoccus sp.]